MASEDWTLIMQEQLDVPLEKLKSAVEEIILQAETATGTEYRSDILWDSLHGNDILPTTFDLSGDADRRLIRQLRPRTAQLDRLLAETCIFRRQGSEIVLVPHADTAAAIPWYLPAVKSYRIVCSENSIVSIHCIPYEHLQATHVQTMQAAETIISNILKCSQKAPNLCRLDNVATTYERLRQRHEQRLVHLWAETEEPTKHILEDLAVAAHLIEIWRHLYRGAFPGFVDVGCGTGVLVDVLTREGFNGWGFDSRRRNTWKKYSVATRKRIKLRLLIPDPVLASPKEKTHNGMFSTGTFIVSNHADQLSAWTPLLASLSACPFLCVPCCAHNLSGERFRIPTSLNGFIRDPAAPSFFAPSPSGCSKFKASSQRGDLVLQRKQRAAAQTSSYTRLCDWIAHLTCRIGYLVDRQTIETPSLRNVGVLGLPEHFLAARVSLVASQAARDLVQTIIEEENVELRRWLACTGASAEVY